MGREEGEDGLTNFEIFIDSLLQKQNLVEPGRSISVKLHDTTVSLVTTRIPKFLEGAIKSNHKTVLGGLGGHKDQTVHHPI